MPALTLPAGARGQEKLQQVIPALRQPAQRYAKGGKKNQKILQPICGTSPQKRCKFFEFKLKPVTDKQKNQSNDIDFQ